MAFIFVAGAWAQPSAGFGAVAGTVFQSSVDGMPDAEVVLSNPVIGVEITFVTTDDGLFSTGTVIPSAGYVLKVAHKGYPTWKSEPFAVSAGQTVRFRITLELDKASGDLVPDYDKSGTAAIVTPEEVQDLPSGGGRLDELIALAPGVTTAGFQPGLLVTHGRPYSNAVTTDGIDTTNAYRMEDARITRLIPQEAIEGVQDYAAGFPPSYGGAMGSIINTATKTGGTAFHGSLYSYYRGPSIASDDKFAAGADVRQTQHRSGASVGGPINKQLFFFANGEFMNRDANGVNRITNPLIADPTGTSVLASNCTATAAQCAAATKFLQSQMNVLVPLPEHAYSGFGRVDYRRTDGSVFSFDVNVARYKAPSLAQSGSVAPNGGLLGDPLVHEDNRFAKASWTTAGALTENDLRIGWNQDRVLQDPSSPLPSTGYTGIDIAGTSVGAKQPLSSYVPDENRFQLVDNFRVSANRHQFQFGGDITESSDRITSLENAAGKYTYTSLTAFAQDLGGGSVAKNYSVFNQTVGTPVRTLRPMQFNAYAGDTWKASDNLSVTMALRYEKPRVPKPSETNTDYYNTGSISSPGLDLAPRIGLAYMAGEATVLRLGYSFFYAPFPTQMLDYLYLGNGMYQTNFSINPNQTGAPTFGTSIPAASVPYGTTNLDYAGGKFRNGVSHEISAAIEKRVSKTSTLTLGFISSKGERLWTTTDINLTSPAASHAQNSKIPSSETYAIDNSSGQVTDWYTTNYWTAKNDAKYAHINSVLSNGSAYYYGLSAQVETRLSHGQSVSAAYTWSHATDNLGINSSTGFTPIGSTTGDINVDKGTSATDQRHRGVIRWNFRPTVAKGTNLSQLINGWVISGIGSGGSAQPVSPLALVQGQPFSNATMLYTTSLNGSGGWDRVPFQPVDSRSTSSQYTLSVNSLRTTAQFAVDLRVARSVSFNDRIKATLAFDAYNLLNRQTATIVNTIGYVATPQYGSGLTTGALSGVLTPVTGLGNGLASQGTADGTNARRCQVELRIAF
jgi:hypothetical protein